MSTEGRPELGEYKEKSRLWKKAKEMPAVPIGIAGLIGAVTYGVVNYKKRGNMSTSVYVMQFRVISQAMVVGAMTLGVAAAVLPQAWRYAFPKSDEGKR